ARPPLWFVGPSGLRAVGSLARRSVGSSVRRHRGPSVHAHDAVAAGVDVLADGLFGGRARLPGDLAFGGGRVVAGGVAAGGVQARAVVVAGDGDEHGAGGHRGVVDDGQPAERLGDGVGRRVVGVGGVDLGDGDAGEFRVSHGALGVAALAEHAGHAGRQALDAGRVVDADGGLGGRVVAGFRGAGALAFLRLVVAEKLVEVAVHLGLVDGAHGLAVVAGAVDGGDRDGLEGDVAAGQALHLGGETEDVPIIVQHHGTLHGGAQLVEAARVGQHAGGEHLVGE